MKQLLLLLVALSTIVACNGPTPDAEELLPQGLERPENWQTLAPWTSSEQFTVNVAELPDHYDLDDVVPGGLPPVNRQAWNDCWAQATVGVLQILVKMVKGIDMKMSVQEIISCSNMGTARSGGWIAHGYHQKKGGVDEPQFPYVGRDVRCKSGLKPQHWLAKWGYVGSPNRKPTFTEVMQAMVQYGPLSATITANGAMSRFTGGGVFKGCSSGWTNHLVVLTGYDKTKKLLKFRNSWGEHHGDKGYVWIPWGCSRIAEDVTYAVLKK